MRHECGHDGDECVADVASHMLQSLVRGPSGMGADGEESLRAGYVRLLRAAQVAFRRQLSTLRCAEWVDASDNLGTKGDSATECGIVVLSSSETQDTTSTSSEPTGSLGEAGPSPLPPIGRLPLDSTRDAPMPSGNVAESEPAEKMPAYLKMPIDELKSIAESYGLRVSTPRRLLAHQLETIWKQMHKGEGSGAAAQERDADPGPLYAQLRRFIRSQPELYDRVLCYQVLEFDPLHRQISAQVPCRKQELRRFLDLEGIVTTGG
ncbi:hypothetical protein GGF46_005238 [Coemansia sp. RSA 552]|nr:hypothetical protein GGF46_005238 [Coemansia sp. RSA 552]